MRDEPRASPTCIGDARRVRIGRQGPRAAFSPLARIRTFRNRVPDARDMHDAHGAQFMPSGVSERRSPHAMAWTRRQRR